MRRYRSERLFQAMVLLVLGVCAIMAVLPFLFLVAASFTDEAALLKHGYRFLPRRWSGARYVSLFHNFGPRLLRASGVSVLATLLGTALHLLIAPLLAWPLARRDYPRRRVLTALVLFPLALSGGIAPWYVVWSDGLHVNDSIWGYILPNLVLTPWEVLLYRQYFRTNIPQSLVDAAKLDGAGEWAVYWKLALPLAAPVLATVGLLVMLRYYSDWENALYFISEKSRWSLQVLVHNFVDVKAVGWLQNEQTDKLVAELNRMSKVRTAACTLLLLPYCLLLPILSRAYTRVIRLGTVKT